MSLSSNINEKYSYFLRKIDEIKKFNLDEESLIIEFEDKILNG
jgi:DNA polymerase-3 subunit delta'